MRPKQVIYWPNFVTGSKRWRKSISTGTVQSLLQCSIPLCTGATVSHEIVNMWSGSRREDGVLQY